jgi:hypothetical protein
MNEGNKVTEGNIKLIGCCGFIGSGKDTFASICEERYGFVRLSFGSYLKDLCCVLFGWNREMIEGTTKESREWRETVDTWWSQELGTMITPRKMMQTWGTDLVRNQFHPEFWVKRCKQDICKYLSQGKSVIVTDCRFPNECELISSLGGKLICLERSIPNWYPYVFPFQLSFEIYCKRFSLSDKKESVKKQCIEQLEKTNIHPSEWMWIFSDIQEVLTNKEDIESLTLKADNIVFSIDH